MSGKPDYEIFKDLNKNILKEKLIDRNSNGHNDFFCNQIYLHSDYSTDAVNLCKEFVHFFTILNSEYSETITNGTRSKYPEFLNYWLNHQFQARNISTLKSDFCDILKTNYHIYGAKNTSNDKINIINDPYFTRINLLYELYKTYYELSSGNNPSCSKFLHDCKTHYTVAWKKCFSEDDPQFCDALKTFKQLYEVNKNSFFPLCQIEGINSLPQLVSPQQTKAGDGKSKKIEEKRSGMLDILRQFFHYCNENKGIPKLSSFYKEFIAEYYKNNKEEYGKIYEFCSTLLKNTESYCKIYQHICTHYINHLSTIKNIKQEEIDEGTEALQWLISEYSSAAIILQLGKDNNVLSNITPILVGTVPGGFLILFFLYKKNSKERPNDVQST
ncbi:PIR Superfamily Protein [Plasmodium ovale curtisi]|uniref:PIR Superfamily Protein n=1 Tax=Plasmodium ovale curtisi TaxID=864141 RepID=A0A1A8XBF3_PLAOA|nr:PIR Superfamily Protein [Plasmodium ovale curtisi]SBT02556.1 PIR Superfamily Protein [Plasmodium ovale curtisi]